MFFWFIFFLLNILLSLSPPLLLPLSLFFLQYKFLPSFPLLFYHRLQCVEYYLFFNPPPNLFNVLFFLGQLKSNCYYLFFHFKLTFFFIFFACFLFFSCKTNKLTFSKAYLKLHIMPSFFVFKKLKYFNSAFFWMIFLISLISCFCFFFFFTIFF